MIEWGDSGSGASIIKVVGVGGGGCNAVNHMYKLGIKDVGFIVCNTDMQALSNSPVPVKVQLGKKITEGLGAGSEPERGRMAAEESLNEIAELMQGNTKMVFITAGMGGGTGTGAAPVIAKMTKNMGILTVAIVTIPFQSMEPLRIETAYSGIRELRKYVDSLLVINNERLLTLYGDLKFSESFAKADEVLCTAAKSIAEIITVSGHINVDFADVRTVMQDSGVALIGIGRCSGEDRAMRAVNQAITSPLLYNNSIRGAKKMLVNIMMGDGDNELSANEIKSINGVIREEVGGDGIPNIKTGAGISSSLGNEVTVSIIATGFEMGDIDIPDDTGDRKPPKSSASKGSPEILIPPIEPDDEDIFPIETIISKGGDVRRTGRNHHYSPVDRVAGVGVVPKNLDPQGVRIPALLDKTKPIEELERRPARSARQTGSSGYDEGEISKYTFNKNSSRWETTAAAYINGKPD